jgi:hypothetical protein
MPNSVKIRTLTAPSSDFATFDPGEYLSGLEFYETGDPITEDDRQGLARLAHLLAYFALQGKSSKWSTSMIPRSSLAFKAFETHFSERSGWAEITQDPQGIYYKDLASFLMEHYPPQRKQ